MISYYQMVKPIGSCQEVYRKTSELEMNPASFITRDKRCYLGLNFSPNNLNKFDEVNKDLNIEYLLIANIEFEKIIDNANQLEIKIIDAKIKVTDDFIQEEFERYLSKREYNKLANLMNENNIIVKEVEFLYNGMIIRIYDSGIIWSDSNFSSSPELTHLIESILELIE